MPKTELVSIRNGTERIGVFVCHCGLNIAGAVDMERVVAEIRKYPGVVYAERYQYMCSDPGQNLMREAIREYHLDAIVNANCAPSLHEKTFRSVVASEVIGGGIAGMQSALTIANTGYEVVLVESSPWIGGRLAQISSTFPTLDRPECLIAPMMAGVASHPRITLYAYSEIEEASGYVGNFVAIHIPFAEAVPQRPVIDNESCMRFTVQGEGDSGAKRLYWW
ncbi:MAG: hypothetical protein DDT25_01268 [Chloroflexi bacterium]|nr:hypothetical protein [Chloroflexota bacterium]